VISACQSASVSSSVVEPGFGDNGAAAYGVDEDVDPAEALGGVGDHAGHCALIERIGMIGMGLAACSPDLGDGRVQPLAIGVDGGDASAFPSNDVGGGPPRCRSLPP